MDDRPRRLRYHAGRGLADSVQVSGFLDPREWSGRLNDCSSIRELEHNFFEELRGYSLAGPASDPDAGTPWILPRATFARASGGCLITFSGGRFSVHRHGLASRLS
jgi:hypothetical protein